MRRFILSPKEIWELAEQRRNSDDNATRQARYERQLDYYFGVQKKGSMPVRAMNSLGKPLMRTGSVMDIPRTITANRIAPLVDDRQAFLGRLPNVRTDVADHTEGGIGKAELQDHFLYSTYEMCRMELQQAQAGFYLSTLGDSVYTCEIDWDAGPRVVVSSVDPQYCYPSFFRGYRKFEVFDLVIAYYEDADTLKREYGYVPERDEDDYYLCVTYLSPFQRTVVIGRDLHTPFGTVEWDLGFCPAVWMWNKITNGALAVADIAQVLELQDVSDFALNVMTDGLVQFVYPMVGIRDPISVAPDGTVEYGPGRGVLLGDKGGIEVAQMGGNVGVLSSFQGQIAQDIATGAGSSMVRQVGMPDKSNISGHAIKAAQGPESTRIDLVQMILGGSFAMLNHHIFAMQERAPLVGAKEIEINGRFKGKSFTEKFRGDRDIDGWYRNTVTWDALMGMSKAQRIQAAGQAKALRLMSDRSLMEWVGVEDPISERAEIERDIIREAEAQAKAQAAAQKAMQGDGASGGAQSPPQPPSPSAQGRVVRPAHMQPTPTAPPQGVNPQGVTLKQIQDALSSAANLKGSVFAVGELAVQGRTLNPKILIADHRDYAKVKTALADLAPNADIKYKPENEMPDLKEKVA